MNMKLLSWPLTILGGIASGGAVVAEENYRWVNELSEFEELFVGARILDPEDSANFFVIRADGLIEGIWYGNALSGAWRWEDGYFCRTLAAPRPAPEDCQEWSRDEGMVRLVRDRGDGEATTYVLGD